MKPWVPVALFIVLATLYSIAVPLFEGNDESWHYAYVWHINSERALPRQPPEQYPHLARQEASQPPLYYLLAAGLSHWIPQDDLMALYRRENPYPTLQPTGYRDNYNHYIHTDAERFPYRGAALAIHLTRLLSVLFGAGTVWGTYHLARRLFPAERGVAAMAALTVALTPGFLFTAGLVNNDALAAFLATVTLLLLVRIAQGATAWPTFGLLGLALGAAALTKLSGLLLWPFAALVLATAARNQRSWRILQGAGLAFGIAVLVCGWWYARNLALYGDVTGLRPMLAIVGRRPEGFGLRELLLTEGKLLYLSYWAVFGWFNIAAPQWVYTLFTVLTVAGGGGLLLLLIRALRRRDGRCLRAVGFSALWALIALGGLIRWSLTTGGSQGRLLYPAISAISLLLARGWWELFPRRWGAWPMAGIGAVLLMVAVYLPFGVIVPAYAPPRPMRPEEVAKAVPYRADVRFGDGIRLLGYGVEPEEVRPGETFWVTLCWRGEGRMDTDYLVSLALQTGEGLTAGHRATYPGLGTFPTSLWPVGMIFCDRYPLTVRDTVPVSASGVLAVGLTTFTERLPVYNGQGARLGDTFLFPGPRILVPEGGPSLAYEWGHRVALVGYRLERSVLTPGETLEITLYWRALRDCPQCAATVQVLRGMDKVGQSDLPLPPIAPGEMWEDRRQIPLWEGAAMGVYELKVAVYDSGGNLPLYRGAHPISGGGLLSLWEIRLGNETE